MRARVFVTLKPSVFDPQGRTIADALHWKRMTLPEIKQHAAAAGLDVRRTDGRPT